MPTTTINLNLSYVESVSGSAVDNTDPLNPIITLPASGMSGVGNLGFLPKINTIDLANNILTLSNSAFNDANDQQVFINKSFEGVSTININTTDTTDPASSSSASSFSSGGNVISTYAIGYNSSSFSNTFDSCSLTVRDLALGADLTRITLYTTGIEFVDALIKPGTLSQFVDDGIGHVVIRSLDDGMVGQSLFTNGGNNGFYWSTINNGTTTNPLSIGTGLSGTSFDGSSAVTIAIDSSVVTLTGSQALSNKTGNISQWTNDSNFVSLSSVLTGISISGNSITNSDTIISAFGALQNQINGILGGAIYIGIWNATTNTPTISDATGTKGHYYVVSVAGTINLGSGAIQFEVGDWAIHNGTIYQKVDNTDAVASVNGSLGSVVITTTGTTDRISVVGGSGLTPTIDIASTYIGQSSITTLSSTTGITTGVWKATIINPAYGGTGVNNGSNTVTIAGNLITTGAFNTTFAQQSTSTITLPASTSTLLANNLGISGGSTLIGGTAVGDKQIFRATSFASNTASATLWQYLANSTVTIPVLSFGDFGGTGDNYFFSQQTTPSSSNYWLRAGASYSYFNAATDLRLLVGSNAVIVMSSSSISMRQPVTMFTAMKLTLAAGTTTVQPLLYQTGTLLTTAVQFSSEVSSEGQLFWTPGTARNFVGIWGYIAKTANYTATVTDYTIDCTANSFTVTLPTAGASVTGVPAGRVYIIKNSGAGIITLATTSSQTVDGTTPPTILAGGKLIVQSTGTNWIIIG